MNRNEIKRKLIKDAILSITKSNELWLEFNEIDHFRGENIEDWDLVGDNGLIFDIERLEMDSYGKKPGPIKLINPYLHYRLQISNIYELFPFDPIFYFIKLELEKNDERS